MRHELRRIADGRQVVLRETGRAMTPFGGLVVLVELLRQLDFLGVVRRSLPFRYVSNNAMAPEETFLAFVLGVAAGARRFSHLQMLRCDEALRQLCGVRAFPTDDTVRNFFRRFGQGQVDQFFLPLWQWLLQEQAPRACTLDLDSTVFQRYGRQEGAVRGYNPTRRKGNCHHPLLAFLGQPMLVLHSWLRSGNAADSGGAVDFLKEALALLPPQWTISAVRADCGFFDQALLELLEERTIPYTVVVRRKGPVWQQVHAVQTWTTLDATHSVGEFRFCLPTWSRERRFVVLRIRLKDTGPSLVEVPRYDYRVFVTTSTEAPAAVWHHYDQRAAIEPRISELKADLAADDFCLRGFFPTEAAVRSVFLVFNLLSVLQALPPVTHARSSQARPATVRHQLFTCAAAAGRCGHKIVLFLAHSWGGLHSRKALLDIIASLRTRTSPKLKLGLAAAPP
jgi:hypothetical protein